MLLKNAEIGTCLDAFRYNAMSNIMLSIVILQTMATIKVFDLYEANLAMLTIEL